MFPQGSFPGYCDVIKRPIKMDVIQPCLHITRKEMLTPQPLDLPPMTWKSEAGISRALRTSESNLVSRDCMSGQPMNQPKTVITTTLTRHIIPETWPEARLPSPYSFEDLPGILNQPQEYLTPAAPSSIYARSFLLGHSPAQLSCSTF